MPPVVSSSPAAAAKALHYPDLSQPALPLSTNIADGATIELQCGRVYQGTLDLHGRNNVTVRTAGSCGKAILTAAQPVTGWKPYQQNIYVAPVGFDAAQVMVDAQPAPLAHWPNRSQGWATAASVTTTSLSYAMPNADLVGATLVFSPFEWAIDARKITDYSNGTMSLASTGKPSFDGFTLTGQPAFYVEGKLWMLDEPGEWAVSNGQLYLWTPDGQSPEGRVWAAADQDAINAASSHNVSIDGIQIFGAANGINSLNATGLHVSNVDIANSSENGILNSGGSALSVDRTSIRNSRHDAIAVKWGGGSESITNVQVDASGTIGMPTSMHAAINLTGGIGAVVSSNTVTNSGYIGIRAFRNATVSQNTVDTGCLVLSDCGGIYVSAPDEQPLNTKIDANTIRNVGTNVRLAWGIQLDNSANGVTVTNNIVSGNGNGLMIFNGFNNTISGNSFAGNTQAQIQMAESDNVPGVRNNAVVGNTFSTTGNQEMYRLSSDFGTASVAQFGSYDRNSYTSTSSIFANFNASRMSFDQWKAVTGQDAASTLKAQ